MSDPFGPAYAGMYDALYQDKDYVAECNLLEHILADHRGAPMRDIIDMGCGTGGHAELLAQRGHHVLGVDRSAHMIEHARAKARLLESPIRPEYHIGDIRSFRIEQRFDVALLMFAVLGYQLEDNDVLSTLRTARAHLRDHGLVIFDCWYGPAVLHQRPTQRRKSVIVSEGRITRSATADLDAARNQCTIRFRVEHEVPGRNEQTEETHRVRYFFADELEQFLHAAGFSLLTMSEMMNPKRPAGEDTWNILAVARATSTTTPVFRVVARHSLVASSKTGPLETT
jgi:SAM-dependent methyltransferase